MLETELAHFGNKLFSGNACTLTPTSHGHFAVLGIDTRRKHIGILGQSSFREFRIGHQRSAQHHTRNAGLSQTINGFKAADTAAHFDLQTSFLDDALDNIDVFRHTASGSVEIDHVNPTRTLLLEESSLSCRVIVVYGYRVIVALCQANRLTAQNINSRKNIHDVPFAEAQFVRFNRANLGRSLPMLPICWLQQLSESLPTPWRQHPMTFPDGIERRIPSPSALRTETLPNAWWWQRRIRFQEQCSYA